MRLFFFLLTAFLLLTGCSKKDISCSEDTVVALVHELTEPKLIDTLLTQNLQKQENPAATLMALGIMCAGSSSLKKCLEGESTTKVFLDKNRSNKLLMMLKQATKYDEVIKASKKAKFSLTDILTQNKNKELQKVECKATANYALDNKTYSYYIDYNAQLTDDKKKIYVEITNIEPKGE